MRKVLCSLIFSAVFFLAIASSSAVDAKTSDVRNSKAKGNTDQIADTLPNLASRFFEIGVGMGTGAIQNADDLVLLKTQFEILTPENCMKPAAIQNESGEFDFSEADTFVALAKENQKEVVGHCLVWAKDDRTPPWFYLEDGKLASRDLLDQRMKTHIETVIGRYPEIKQWDVVNEVLGDGGAEKTYRESKWQEIYGSPEFVVNAFKYARAAAPNATLVYNDYRAERKGKLGKLLTLIKYLKTNDAPVDAIGLQGHYELDDVPYEQLQTAFDEIRKLGLKVIISEVDIDVVKRGSWYAADADRESIAKTNPYEAEMPADVDLKLAQQYKKLFELYLKNSDLIGRVTFWNLNDRSSWLNYFPWKRTNYPLLFDRNAKPKTAYQFVQLAFQEAIESSAATTASNSTEEPDINKTIPPATVFSLWPNGAPGFEDRKDEPEEAKDWWVKNVHNPSLTCYLPDPEKNTGAAVVICPGGGHRTLVFNAEGSEAADYFNELGVAVFVLKYRLGREENSPYKIDVHAKQDGQRAMRWVRHHAPSMGIDDQRIGLVGFSAGGEVVSMVAYGNHEGEADAKDPIDKKSCKPAFQVMIYPGPLGIPETIPAGAPPAFLLVANDDGAARVVLSLAQKLRAAKVPTEMHLFTLGGHGFNMGNRTKLKSIKNWRHRMGDWMLDNGYLKKLADEK